MEKGNTQKAVKPTQYVVGGKEEEFCWLLAQEKGEPTDDQNIELARRFTSLEEAQAAAEENMGTVFELIDETTWPATLEEVF
jgi:hypothetical protein